MAKAIGVLGTMSGVGKSTVSLLLIRYLKRYMGLRVAPFKGQNMSLNAKVTPEGYEMASAQYYGALAAGVVPSPVFNPILLKPSSPTGSHMVIMGKPAGVVGSKNWVSHDRERLWQVVKTALDRVLSDFDYVVIEGAGSPAEINLKPYDITNLRPMLYSSADAVLVADIDRGGSFAQIVGTMELLEPRERDIIKVFVLNKFRGDESLLEDGIAFLRRRYGIPTVVLPYVRHNLPEEDALKPPPPLRRDDITVAVVLLPHMSNHDDFDPLRGNVNVVYASKPVHLSGADMVILPGSRAVATDLMWLEKIGMADAIRDFAAEGGLVFGICGGYQMLGRAIEDPEGVERRGKVDGLGLADAETVFRREKILKLSRGRVMDYVPAVGGLSVSGYQIHHGITHSKRPFAILDGEEDGYFGGNVIGTYLHGIFANARFSEALFNYLRRRRGLAERPFDYIDPISELDRVLDILRPRVEEILGYLL